MKFSKCFKDESEGLRVWMHVEVAGKFPAQKACGDAARVDFQIILSHSADGTQPAFRCAASTGLERKPCELSRHGHAWSRKEPEETAMADNDSGIGGFGWFLAGLGIGALVGVLYAPKSGKETRDDLVAGALEARDKAGEYYNQGVQQASEYVQQGKEAVGTYVGKGKEVAGAYVDKGKEYYDKGRTQWSEYVEKGKDLVQTQTDAVNAAVSAGKDAYVQTANPPAGENS